MGTDNTQLIWHKALDIDELPEGRVKPVTLGHVTVAMTRYDGRYGALNNKCPHQGGPLGEGSIEKGQLRCPWHGWDFCPNSGKTPGYDDGVDAYAVEVREDGIYVGLEPENEPATTVSDIMVETMINWGVKHVFGMVGHSNLGFADALRTQEKNGNLSFYGIRHEGAAAFAVSAYGKLTGRPAACFSIAGPGATNLLTGLWDANVDRAPALALTGQVDTQVVGAGAFQEIDLMAAFGKVAQWAQPVLQSSKHAELMTLACKSAILNRGVSHLIFPDEVQAMQAPESSVPASPEGRITAQNIAPPKQSLQQALGLLRSSSRPVMIVGHGARFDMPAILELAEMLGSPVLTTFKAKGLISDSHPLGCGVLGRSGTPIASYFMNESDCLLVLGASFSNHNAIMAVDVGNNTYSFGRYFECEQHSVLMSGYLGSIGFSLPAAMGAWAATQEDDERFKGRKVISVSGDGGFGQYLAEVSTAVKYGMNITHVLLNNCEIGKISKEQKAANWDVWQTSLVNPNFAKYVSSYGALGIRVRNRKELDEALKTALVHDGFSLVEVISDAALI